MTPDHHVPRVGILGAGQLGRMLALAGRPLGIRFRFLDPKEEASAGELGEYLRGPYRIEDPGPFLEGLTAVTYEFENVPVETAHRLAEGCPVYPPPGALEVAQDRLVEKETFEGLGIPVAPWRPVDSRADLDLAVEALGLPAVLKTRRLGYDGKGQVVLRAPGELDDAWERLGDRPLILESFVAFERELSCLMVRSARGEVATYPVGENTHREGILRSCRVPAVGLRPERRREAEEHVLRLLEHLEYVGVLTVEFFETKEGLLANEMAPRVHNSGHWSQDGALTSQFENHIRAILGLPLGSPGMRVDGAGMVNLIGGVPPREQVLALPGVHLHLYEKEPRPGRKVGHVNVVAEDPDQLEARLREVQALAEAFGEG